MSIGAVGMTGSLVLGGSQKWSKAGHGDAVGAFRVAGQQGARGLGLRHVVTWLRGKEVHSPPCPDPHSLAELRPVEGLPYLCKPCSWANLTCSAPQRSVCLSVHPSQAAARAQRMLGEPTLPLSHCSVPSGGCSARICPTAPPLQRSARSCEWVVVRPAPCAQLGVRHRATSTHSDTQQGALPELAVGYTRTSGRPLKVPANPSHSMMPCRCLNATVV